MYILLIAVSALAAPVRRGTDAGWKPGPRLVEPLAAPTGHWSRGPLSAPQSEARDDLQLPPPDAPLTSGARLNHLAPTRWGWAGTHPDNGHWGVLRSGRRPGSPRFRPGATPLTPPHPEPASDEEHAFLTRPANDASFGGRMHPPPWWEVRPWWLRVLPWWLASPRPGKAETPRPDETGSGLHRLGPRPYPAQKFGTDPLAARGVLIGDRPDCEFAPVDGGATLPADACRKNERPHKNAETTLWQRHVGPGVGPVNKGFKDGKLPV